MDKTNTFVIMWDCNGLEAIAEVPDPVLTTFALLKNQKPPEMPNIEHWKLRARFNPQRHYEIYIVNAVKGIAVEDIREMFNSDPQTAADTIRRLGHCYYSERATQRPVIV